MKNGKLVTTSDNNSLPGKLERKKRWLILLTQNFKLHYLKKSSKIYLRIFQRRQSISTYTYIYERQSETGETCGTGEVYDWQTHQTWQET
jgi:hypothetical protein